MIFQFLFFGFSQIFKIHKEFISNNYDLVSVDILQKLGWLNINWDSVDELNRALYTFDVIDKVSIRIILTLTTFYSEKGNKNLEQPLTSKFPIHQRGIDMYRGAGYMGLSGYSEYESFSKMIGDSNIINIGAEYVANHYPWASSVFLCKGLFDGSNSIINAYLNLIKYHEMEIKLPISILKTRYPLKTLIELYNQVESIF